jgi:protein phosphatase
MRGSVGPRIDLERLQLADGDRVLVCTNGLTDMVEESVVAEVLGSGQSPDDQCRTLVDLAMAEGGEDDATALVALYRIPE